MKAPPSFLVIGVLLVMGVAWWMNGRQEAVDQAGETKPRRMKASNRDERMMGSPVERSSRIANEMKPEGRTKFALHRFSAMEKAKKAVLQEEDTEKRNAALEEIRAMMADGDLAKVMDGIGTFVSLSKVDFDKESFRPLVLPHLKAEDEGLRTMAWSALVMIGLTPEDSELMREVAGTMGMGDQALYFLVPMERGDLRGETGEFVRNLLDPADARKTREVVRLLQGANFSPELESRIVEISRHEELFHDVVYHALTTQQNKGPQTVARLIDAMQGPDLALAERAAWGLGIGVPEELGPQVADAAIKAISSPGTGYAGTHVWRMLESHVSASHVPALRELLARPNLKSEDRVKLQQMIGRFGATN